MPLARVLVDISVWIDLFGQGKEAIQRVISHRDACCHPFVVGEFAVGNLGNRHNLIKLLKKMYKARVMADDDVLKLVKNKKLHGRGIGYIDCHLLASAYFGAETTIWTLDKRLYAAATELGVAYNPKDPVR